MSSKGSTNEHVVAAKPHRPWWRRIGYALIAPIVLLIIATIVLNMFSTDSTESIAQAVDKYWLPTTIARLVLYCVLAFLIVPTMLKHLVSKSKNDISALHHAISEEELSVKVHHQNPLVIQYQRAKAQHKVYLQLLRKRWVVFMILIGFDVLTIQVPFLLR